MRQYMWKNVTFGPSQFLHIAVHYITLVTGVHSFRCFLPEHIHKSTICILMNIIDEEAAMKVWCSNSGRGTWMSVRFLCMCIMCMCIFVYFVGLVRPTLCTTSMVQEYIVHHQPWCKRGTYVCVAPHIFLFWWFTFHMEHAQNRHFLSVGCSRMGDKKH